MSENLNNFVNFSNESSKDLSDLDAAFTDPFVERVLEMGRTYNKIFEEASPTYEESKSVIEELDMEWGNIKGTLIQYTGNVRVRDLDTEG